MLQLLCALFLLFSFQSDIYVPSEVHNRLDLSLKACSGENFSYCFLEKQRVLKKQVQNSFCTLKVVARLLNNNNDNPLIKEIQKILLNTPSRAGPIV